MVIQWMDSSVTIIATYQGRAEFEWLATFPVVHCSMHDAEHMHIMWPSTLHCENVNFKVTIYYILIDIFVICVVSRLYNKHAPCNL